MAFFAAFGQSALPSIYLKTPDGQTITPSNAGSFPGVTYQWDEAERMAYFRILDATAGTWVLGESSLPAGELTFLALVPKAPPLVTVASNASGSVATVTATVDPPGDQILVTLGYSRSADGVPEGLLGGPSPASTGTVSAEWDTAGVASGTYYLLAIADDGMNAPVTAFAPSPLIVQRGNVEPPSSLAGIRSGNSVALAWTASPSPSVAGYQVLYTDAPEVPGYSCMADPASGTSLTVPGLDPAKAYRFCVQAFDNAGQYSPESAPWTAAGASPFPGDCDGNGLVSIGEVQKGINMYLGTQAIGCGADGNGDGAVSIGEVQKVINGFLGIPEGIAVSVTPAEVTLDPGGVQQFAAAVTGTANAAVAWSVLEGAAGGSVTASGLYAAPQAEGTYHPVATSQADPIKSAAASVTVRAPCTLLCEASAFAGWGGNPLSAAFSATASPDGCAGKPTFLWGFGDGQTSPDENPTHTYAAPGTYAWTLETEVSGVRCARAGTVTVTPSACAFTCGASAAPTSGMLPLVVQFAATVMPSNCTGTFELLWDFGDGQTSTQPAPPHTYGLPGTFEWTLTMTFEGQSCTRTGTVTVDSPPCSLTCTASAAPASGLAPLAVQFSASAAPLYCSGPVAYLWVFGDGQTSAEQNPTHTYASPGSFAWALTASADDKACSQAGTVSAEDPGIPLTSGVPFPDTIEGTSPNSAWKYYSIQVPAGAIIVVTVTNLTGDVDLYLKRGSRPATSQYDCRSFKTGIQSESCWLSGGEPGVVFVGVTNYSAGTIGYTVTATIGARE